MVTTTTSQNGNGHVNGLTLARRIALAARLLSGTNPITAAWAVSPELVREDAVRDITPEAMWGIIERVI